MQDIPQMKGNSIIFLQLVIVLMGFSALAFLLWEPHVEGRNAHATVYQIYFNDPFLAYAYLASIPFFVALYQAFRVLGYAGQNRARAVKSLRNVKYCAILLIGFVALGEVLILMNTSDDRAGGVFMGFLAALGAIAMTTAANVYERILQRV